MGPARDRFRFLAPGEKARREEARAQIAAEVTGGPCCRAVRPPMFTLIQFDGYHILPDDTVIVESATSIEFTEDALDEQQAARGAWLEVTPDDASALKKKILAAGLSQVKHPRSDRFYFKAPGGQIWGIVES